MVATAASVEWIVVSSDVEAIMLEYNLIKAHRPRFNVRLVDDKSYPYLAVTVGDEWPKAAADARGSAQGHADFGPYAHAYAIRETLDLLLRPSPSGPVLTPSSTVTSSWQALPALPHRALLGPLLGAVDPE